MNTNLTRILRFALLGVLAFSLTPAFAQDDTEPHPLSFFLSFVPNVQFSPLYVGMERGYFAEAGLALDIIHGDENVGLEAIAAERFDAGMISGEQVILARANGREVTSIYEWFQRYPVAVVVADTAAYAEPADLAGLRVGLPGRFGANYTALTAFLDQADLVEQDVALSEIGFNAPAIFCAEQVDAAAVYINNEPLQIQTLIDAGECGGVTGITVEAVADYADMVSNGIVVNSARLDEDPDTLRALTTAFDRALAESLANPARAYLDSLPYVDNLPADESLIANLEAEADAVDALIAEGITLDALAERRTAFFEALAADHPAADLVQFQVLLATLPLWDAPRLGLADAESWETTRAVVAALTGTEISAEVVEAAFTNAFLPPEAE